MSASQESGMGEAKGVGIAIKRYHKQGNESCGECEVKYLGCGCGYMKIHVIKLQSCARAHTH